MIFKFSICDYEGCNNWYFDVDDNLTREEIIEKIHKAFRVRVKNELNKDSKRPLGEKYFCTEKESLDFFSNSTELNKEFEKVGLKKIELSTYGVWYDENAYTLLGIDTECRGPENCQKPFCSKVHNWKENK